MYEVLVTCLPGLVLYTGDDLAMAQSIAANGVGRYVLQVAV